MFQPDEPSTTQPGDTREQQETELKVFYAEGASIHLRNETSLWVTCTKSIQTHQW